MAAEMIPWRRFVFEEGSLPALADGTASVKEACKKGISWLYYSQTPMSPSFSERRGIALKSWE
jgi:hypothetical protein